MEALDIFRDRLRKTREERRLSQSQLAELINLPPSSISHFENGPRKPSFDNLKKLADALNVTTDYLLGRSSTPEGTAQVDALARTVNGLSNDHRNVITAVIEALRDKKKA